MPITPKDFSFEFALPPPQMGAAYGAMWAAIRAAIILKAEEIFAAHDADLETRYRLFDTYAEHITRETKGLVAERLAIPDEAAGIGSALELIQLTLQATRDAL